jgi:N6-adenosine-specific RNA methylase IME4
MVRDSEEPEVQRPKRRCARALRAELPSAVHYVGYVEDGETPEMIMAKFAELERIKGERAAARAARRAEGGEAGDGGASGSGAPGSAPGGAAAAEPRSPAGGALDDDALLEVFRQTSAFNVRGALDPGADGEEGGDAGGDSGDDEWLRSFWSDAAGGGGASGADSDSGDSGSDGGGRRPRRRGGGGGARAARAPGGGGGGARARHAVVTAWNPATNALVRRRVRVAGPDELVHVRVPPAPLPRSWGRAVRPYAPAGLLPPAAATPEDAARTLVADSVEAVPRGELFGDAKRPFLAAMVGAGWARDAGDAGAAARLAALDLKRLVPDGFLFIWAPPRRLAEACRAAKGHGFSYIENLTWVQICPGGRILAEPVGAPLRGGHLTLAMFRRADRGRDIELRHQRSPDVLLDCVCAAPGAAPGAPAPPPAGAFEAVETLLPTARGRFLELWAAPGSARPGWTHVVDRRHLA